MLLSTLYFAGMNICIKLLGHLPAIELVFFRALVTLILSYAVLRYKGLSVWGNNKKLLLLRGIAGFMGLFLYFYTVQHMPLAAAVTIQYLSPIFTVLLAMFILKERLYPIQWLFFAISFAGVFLIKGIDPRITNYLALLGIASAFFSGLAYNFIRKLKDYDDPLVVVFYFPLVTLPLATPVTVIKWVQPEGIEWLLLILTGVFTQFGQVAMTRAYQLESTGNVSILNYVGIIYALFIGYFFFDEGFTALSIAGMLLVVVGVLSNILYGWRKRVIQVRNANKVTEEV